MNRLGIAEGESIESSIVTRAVENAQKKVESMHFESRKHLLEYDDVANEQRKTIYKYRNELLDEDFNIRAKISQNIGEYVSSLPNDQSLIKDDLDIDIEALKVKIATDFNLELKENLENLSTDELMDKLDSFLNKSYDEKMSVLDELDRKKVERIFYLQVLDNAYREHLYQMDILKTGISLRGYNQKDPLVEYKKESYNLFLELVERIKFESIKLLFSLKINEKDSKNFEERASEKNDELLQNSKQSNGQEETARETVSSSSKKIPRNSPCPCGSGKKYKECCGKSGPKRGILA